MPCRVKGGASREKFVFIQFAFSRFPYNCVNKKYNLLQLIWSKIKSKENYLNAQKKRSVRSTWKLQNLCYFLQRHLYFSPEGNSYGTREITRLDTTMQLLIQDILSKIIDSSLYFPDRFCDFSCMRIPFKIKCSCK